MFFENLFVCESRSVSALIFFLMYFCESDDACAIISFDIFAILSIGNEVLLASI